MASEDDVVSLVNPSSNWTRWGGRVVQDDDGSFHLFAAEMAYNCGLSVWGYKSQVLHAIGNSSTGPFQHVETAIPTEAHNPVITRDPSDGTWLIWTCGCPHVSDHDDCSFENVQCPGGAAPAWTTTVYSSKSLHGPWKPHVNLLGDITKGRLGSQNVSPIIEKDGSVTLMFKGPDVNTEASIATAPHWSGPYTLKYVDVFAKYYDQNITNEDCYFWQQPDGSYHVLSHRMAPADRESTISGGHAFTRDLNDWSYALTPAYTDELALADGKTFDLSRRERPQLFFGSDGQPEVIYNGVETKDDRVFTFAQKLGQ